MARYLIREAHGGGTRIIRDGALPFFLNQGYVVLETLDDDTDASPLYLSAAESDMRYAKISDLGDPESAEVAVISEAVADSEALRAAFGAKANRLRLADVPEPYVLFHRGAGAYLAPENTLEAFELAIELGAKVVEAGDWWLSTDGTLICMHDGTVDRTTTGTGNTVDMTEADRDAAVVDAGSWFGGGWGNLKIPEWDRTMALADRGAILAVEPKNQAAAQVMADAIEAAGLQDSVMPNAFTASWLAPFAAIGCAVGFNAGGAMPSAGTISYLQGLGTTVYVGTYLGGLTAANLATLQAAGFKLSVDFTPRHHQIADLAATYPGVTFAGYGSDDPVYVQQALDSGRLGLLGKQKAGAMLPLRRDPFTLQTYYHGMQSYTNDLNGRGVFVGGNRWQAPAKQAFVLHGWMGPLPDEWEIVLSLRIDAAGSLTSRWPGLWLGTTDHRYSDSGFPDENGCHVRLRLTGSLEGLSKTNGTLGTSPTAASTALTTGTTAKLKLTKTSTDLIIARTDVAATITVPEARALRYLFLGQNGDNGGADSGLRTSFFNVERVA